jgi:hypothetical protein
VLVIVVFRFKKDLRISNVKPEVITEIQHKLGIELNPS